MEHKSNCGCNCEALLKVLETRILNLENTIINYNFMPTRVCYKCNYCTVNIGNHVRIKSFDKNVSKIYACEECMIHIRSVQILYENEK